MNQLVSKYAYRTENAIQCPNVIMLLTSYSVEDAMFHQATFSRPFYGSVISDRDHSSCMAPDRQFPGEQHLSHIDWENYYERYSDELGVDTLSMNTTLRPEVILQSKIVPQSDPDGGKDAMIGHPVFGAATSNWARLMPEDAVIRLKSAEQPFKAFKQIVRETTENAIPGLEIESNDLCAIAHHITNRFAGVDFDSIINEETAEPTDSIPEHVTMVVKCVNQRNFEDWHIYAIDDPHGHFDFNIGIESAGQAAYRLIEGGVTPAQVVDNVAFEIKDTMTNQVVPSVTSAVPPDCPVTIIENHSYEDDLYYKVKSPVKIFGDNWGDIETMRSKLHELSQDGDRINQFQFGDVWYVNAGLAF